MKNNLLLLIVPILLSCSNDEQAITQINDVNYSYTILALGDSLTEGLGVEEKDNYPSILQKHLPKHIKVINAGLSAETSTGLKNRLSWVLKQKPDLTILNIGANDAMRGLPLELTYTNIDEIIKIIKKSDSDVILAGMQIYDNLGKEYVNGFTNIYPQLAHKHNIPLIPFFLEHVAGVTQFNQADMLHPNAKGYNVIVEKNILPVINQFLGK